MAWYGGFGAFPPYVPVAARRARALAAAARLAKTTKGKPARTLSPIAPIEGHKVVRSFWGKAWCDNLESYSDYANRLPRGRSYVRHGCVADLQIGPGRVTALVSGTSLYQITIDIEPLAARRWASVTTSCAGQIDSLVELLRGAFPDSILKLVTNRDTGLFPAPREIRLDCSCPDWAGMCKHVAAALYGVGARLDEKPELLFTLRGVDHADLLGGAVASASHVGGKPAGVKVLEEADLSSVFGIEIDSMPSMTGRGVERSKAGRASRKAKTKAAGARENGGAVFSRTKVAGAAAARPKAKTKKAKKGKPSRSRASQRPARNSIAGQVADALGRAFRDPRFSPLVPRR
jgi:hypothetical protein